MARVYGDSTPFPHDIDYIHMLRDGVDCAVRLLSAQHSIRVAEERAEAAERGMRGEVTELNALFERVQNAARGENPGSDALVGKLVPRLVRSSTARCAISRHARKRK
jgi:hypothetical protein